MLQTGQIVLYGANGVCRITEITTRRIGSSVMEYYVLKPVSAAASTLYVPTNNERLVSRIRALSSEEELRAILEDDENPVAWVDDKTERAALFKQIIDAEDSRHLIGLLRLLRAQRGALAERGRRLHLSDERTLREVEKMAGDEVATVLNITHEEAMRLICG